MKEFKHNHCLNWLLFPHVEPNESDKRKFKNISGIKYHKKLFTPLENAAVACNPLFRPEKT